NAWATLRPIQAGVWPAYARCFYDADIPRLPHIGKASRGIRTVRITIGPRHMTVIPALAARQLRLYFKSQTPLQVIRWPLYGTGFLGLVGFVLGIRSDKQYAEKVRRGVRIDG